VYAFGVVDGRSIVINFAVDQVALYGLTHLRYKEIHSLSQEVAALSLFSQQIPLPKMKGTFMAMSFCSNSRGPVDLVCHCYLHRAWYRVSNKYSAPATAAPVAM
jgi:hypothetical protein